MRSASTLPEAGELVETFRTQILEQLLERLTPGQDPPPPLRNALKGWLGYVDATLLDWTQAQDLSRDQIRQLILAAFGPALLAAQQAEPKLRLDLK